MYGISTWSCGRRCWLWNASPSRGFEREIAILFFRGVDCLSNLCVFPPWCERSIRIVTGISLAFYCCTCVLDEWARVDGSHNARSFPQGGGEIFSDDSSKQYFLSSLYMGSVIHVVLKNTSNTLFVSSHIGLFVRDFNKKLTMISTFVRCTF